MLLLAVGCGGGGNDNSGNEPCPAAGLEVPDVSGDYLVNELNLSSSDCPDLVDDVINDAIDAADDCVFTVSQEADARITAVDCEDNVYQGCVDEAGNVVVSGSERDSDLGCTVEVNAELAASLTSSPSTGTLTLGVDGSGTCAFVGECVAVVDATVTDQAAAPPQSAAGVAPSSATLRALLRP